MAMTAPNRCAECEDTEACRAFGGCARAVLLASAPAERRPEREALEKVQKWAKDNPRTARDIGVTALLAALRESPDARREPIRAALARLEHAEQCALNDGEMEELAERTRSWGDRFRQRVLNAVWAIRLTAPAPDAGEVK